MPPGAGSLDDQAVLAKGLAMSLSTVKHMISTERFAFRIDAANGKYSLYDILKNQFVIENASFAVQAPGPAGSRNVLYAGDDLAFDQDASSADAASAKLVYRHTRFPLGLKFECSTDEEQTSEIKLRIGFENAGQKAFGVRALYPLIVDPLRDGAIDLGGVWSHGAMLRIGRDSDSDSSVMHFSKPDGTDYDSYCFTLLHNLYSQRNLAVGFITLRDQFSKIVATPQTEGMNLCAVCECDDVRVEPGQTLWSETLWMRVTDEENVQIDRYLDLSAQSNQARPCALDKTPTAWSTLHASDGPLTKDVIEANLAVLQTHKNLPLRWVIVDEGWQTHAGDWLTIEKARFGDGMADLASKITSAGYEPGLWIAPFIAQASSALYEQHPDWFLRDASGKPVNVVDRWGGPCYALDLTMDDVLEWLGRIVHTLVDDWGYRCLRLDLLRCSAIDAASRSDMHVTRAQAYRRGIETIRAAAGEGVFLMGSCAALGPSVGVVDSCRTARDLRQTWDIASTGEGIRLSGRDTLVRSNLNGRWFYNDPDALYVRGAGEKDGMTIDERDLLETFIGMSGGQLALSEDLSMLTEEELDSLRFLLPPVPKGAYVPSPLGRHGVPNLYILADEGRRVVAAFNWDDTPIPLTIDVADIGLRKNLPHLVFDVKAQALIAGRVTREWVGGLLAPHSARMITFVPETNSSKPVLLGSTFHISQGIAEVASYEWTRGSMDLEMSTQAWVGQSGILTFFAPEVESASVSMASGAQGVEIEIKEQDAGRTMRLMFSKITSPNVCVKVVLNS